MISFSADLSSNMQNGDLTKAKEVKNIFPEISELRNVGEESRKNTVEISDKRVEGIRFANLTS